MSNHHRVSSLCDCPACSDAKALARELTDAQRRIVDLEARLADSQVLDEYRKRKVAEAEIERLRGALWDIESRATVESVELRDIARAALTLPAPGTPRETPEWQADWPTEKGWYWFCGRRHAIESVTRIVPAQVRHTGSGEPIYISEGAIMYRSEGAQGVWLPLAAPTVPPRQEPTRPETEKQP